MKYSEIDIKKYINLYIEQLKQKQRLNKFERFFFGIYNRKTKNIKCNYSISNSLYKKTVNNIDYNLSYDGEILFEVVNRSNKKVLLRVYPDNKIQLTKTEKDITDKKKIHYFLDTIYK